MGLLIRPVEARDRAAMHDVLVVCGDFTDEEIRAAREMMDDALSASPETGHRLFAAKLDATLATRVYLRTGYRQARIPDFFTRGRL